MYNFYKLLFCKTLPQAPLAAAIYSQLSGLFSYCASMHRLTVILCSAQVYQVISTIATLDNVVEFYFRNQLPSLPGLPAAEPIVATARLRHSLEIQSGSTVRITFESTELKTTGEELQEASPNGNFILSVYNCSTNHSCSIAFGFFRTLASLLDFQHSSHVATISMCTASPQYSSGAA